MELGHRRGFGVVLEACHCVDCYRVAVRNAVSSCEWEDFWEHDDAGGVGWVADFQMEAIRAWWWATSGAFSFPAAAPSTGTGSGASSAIGSVAEIARLRIVGVLLIEAIVMTCPLTSRIRIVTGQKMSMESPREPAKTASVPLVVGNGEERTASWAERPGTSMKNTIWLTSLLLQRWANLASAGNSLEKVPVMVVTLDGSGLYVSAKLLSFASHAAW